MDFARKHLPDQFYLENEQQISLRGVICREMVSNILIHREFSSSFPAKFVIERDRFFTENANRASWTGEITPENFEPNPKNPIIASFFRNIGLADKLGSGVRNIFKYARLYRGGHPLFLEHDIFRISVDFEKAESTNHATVNATVNETDSQILKYIQDNPYITYTELAEKMNQHRATIGRHIKSLAEQRIISRVGSDKAGFWKINIPFQENKKMEE